MHSGPLNIKGAFDLNPVIEHRFYAAPMYYIQQLLPLSTVCSHLSWSNSPVLESRTCGGRGSWQAHEWNLHTGKS